MRVSGPSILDPYKEQLSQWLKADSHRSKRERRGIKAMFEALRAQGWNLCWWRWSWHCSRGE